ncbi:hypothetical protein XppCFBP6982P_11280 [Xanthomonas phaseoli pv. phaseoli]|nr:MULTISPECIES: hypothetical protein [Xanthomonas]ATS23233.1 hypothetical protein XppCFBP412P_18885 [Xanthomonas phaseoli pv. phaseoli]ATS26130.1 hypothetical protein XppCFBP6164P_11820 [Xanthomonas phaseoli pv. phaseoli]ATS30379.1 hypothetical protein XppCFBP6546P_11855 [Xanthomonas phaseoli pv. phaseoli]ATS34388.1 hypothetical protein XppCFBP6982P_11280 [Xanthomonas phaseoli pv. phaseoli]MBO9734824.1 hypothetical protein [Xanthomonas phaseoli pv. phaseoli]
MQFHRRQCRVAADACMQIAQHLGKCQAVGIEQIRRRFHFVQHRGNRREPARVLGDQHAVERCGNALALLQVFVKQLLAHAAGGGAIAWRLCVLIGQQHDDAAVPVQVLAQLRDQCTGGVPGLVRLRVSTRCNSGLRGGGSVAGVLRAAAGQRQHSHATCAQQLAMQRRCGHDGVLGETDNRQYMRADMQKARLAAGLGELTWRWPG